MTTTICRKVYRKRCAHSDYEQMQPTMMTSWDVYNYYFTNSYCDLGTSFLKYFEVYYLPKIPIIWKKVSNKSCWDFNSLRKKKTPSRRFMFTTYKNVPLNIVFYANVLTMCSIHILIYCCVPFSFVFVFIYLFYFLRFLVPSKHSKNQVSTYFFSIKQN